jgi:NADH dehydrogenase (ubiquinone) Fe-S protein 6
VVLKVDCPNIERIFADHRPRRLYPSSCYRTTNLNMLSRRALPSLNHVLRNISRPASTSTSKADNATSSAVTKKADVPLPTTQQQSPNYPSTWSTSQRPRPGFGSGPRFEQTAMDLQPNPLSAMELIAKEPIRLVHGRKAVCDGGIYMSWSSPVTFH